MSIQQIVWLTDWMTGSVCVAVFGCASILHKFQNICHFVVEWSHWLAIKKIKKNNCLTSCQTYWLTDIPVLVIKTKMLTLLHLSFLLKYYSLLQAAARNWKSLCVSLLHFSNKLFCCLMHNNVAHDVDDVNEVVDNSCWVCLPLLLFNNWQQHVVNWVSIQNKVLACCNDKLWCMYLLPVILHCYREVL